MTSARAGAALLLALALPAQGSLPRSSARTLERELAAKREQALRTETEKERLLDALLRRHLGIANAGSDVKDLLTEAERARPTTELEQELAAHLERIGQATLEREALQRALDERRRLAAVIGSTEPGKSGLAGAPPVEEPRPQLPPPDRPGEPDEAAPADEPAAPREPALLSGSLDSAQRGRALFHAGLLERARTELELAAESKAPGTADLFYLARTYERLGDVARADSTYLRIEAQDGDKGRWAAAARTARQHMAWTRDHGTWKAPALPSGLATPAATPATEAKR